MNNNLNEVVVVLLSSRAPFEVDKLDRTYPIELDDDKFNQQNRKNYFLQVRDLLLKLAWTKSGDSDISPSSYPHQTVADEIFTISWDLSRDFNNELVPEQIAEYLHQVKQIERVS